MIAEHRDELAVSIIIPSHNRSARLKRTLCALAPQVRERADVEILVCADGCQDDTAAMVRSLDELPVSVIELPGLGPAGARNAGAEAARGSLLIFLDDDVEPGETFLAAHLEAHQALPGSVVLGPYPPLPFASRSGFRLTVRQWWGRHFEALAEPGHRMSYQDVLTGNLSLMKTVWEMVGGFDPALHAHEDYEFGIRLFKAGVPVIYEPRAHAYHYEHETMQIERLLRRAREEAHADVAIARNHPEIGHGLIAARWRIYLQFGINEVVRAIFAAGERGDELARKGTRLLLSLDKYGLRGGHTILYSQLLGYWYARGLTDCFATFADWRAFTRNLPKSRLEPPLVIDLRKGLGAAEKALDRTRPRHARLIYGEELVGELPSAAGTEPWAGRHLRPFLVRELGPAYLDALARDGLIADCGPRESQRLAAAIAQTGRFYPIRRSPNVWREQAEQWQAVPLSRGADRRPDAAAIATED